MASPLVGRATETATLTRALDELLSGHGSFLHLAGVAGIGKSRLLADVIGEATQRNAAVLATAADETDRLRPWSTTAGLLGGFDGMARHPFDRALHAVETAAAAGPLVLAVDDVHWADSDSVDLLRMVAVRAAMLPVLLVTTARPDESSGGRRLQQAALRHGRAVEVGPLSAEEAGELASALGANDGALLARVIEGAGGNPLLITEVLRDRHLCGGQDRHSPRTSAARSPASTVDADIAGRVMGRMLDGLDEESEFLVRAAAVLPPGFGCDELSVVARRPVGGVVEWSLALVRSGLLVEHGRGLCFRHALLRDIVRQATPFAVADVLRRSAVDYLVGRDGEIERAVICLLDGFDGKDVDEVETALALAARVRSTNSAACADLLSDALAHLGPDDPRLRSVVADLGWSLLAIGRADEVSPLINRYFGEDPSAIPVELLSLEGSAMALAGSLDLAVQRYAGYDIERLETEFDVADPAVVDAVAELASGRVSTGDLPGGLALLEWVERSPTPSSPTRVASVEATRASFCGISGWFAASIEHARAALRAIAQGSGPIVTPASPVVSIALAHDLNGDSDAALAALRDRDLPGIVPAWTEPLFQFAASIVLYRRGDWDDALAEAEAGLAAADEVGLRLSVFWPYAVGALIHLARNRHDLATRCLAQCVDAGASRAVGTEWLTYAAAMQQAEQGELASASATLQAVCAFLIAGELDALLLGFGPPNARLAVRRGDHSGLPALESGLARLAGKSPSPVVLATATWVQGLGRRDGAALAAASDQFAAVLRRPDAARAAADAAVAFQESGDTMASRRSARRAFEEFDQLGAESEHARLRADLRDVGLSVRPRRAPSRPVDGWASLTPAELAVVELVCRGLANGEIGERLFVSRRTVESHLARVFTKIDVTSRTQLVTARRESIVS